MAAGCGSSSPTGGVVPDLDAGDDAAERDATTLRESGAGEPDSATAQEAASSSSGGGGSEAGSDASDAATSDCAVPPSVVSNFEQGTATDVTANGFTGAWYAYGNPNRGAENPVLAVVASDDPTPSCSGFELHTSGGLGDGGPDAGSYASTRCEFLARDDGSDGGALSYPQPEDISQYSGISFDVKVGPGGASTLSFEIPTVKTQPTTQGGAAVTYGVDQYNNRGWLLSTSASNSNATTIGPSWQTIYVPFSLLIPRWLPTPETAGGCTPGIWCQAPAFEPTQALEMQFALNPEISPGAAFDLDVGNVALYKGDQGLVPPNPPNGITPSFADGTLGSCTKPVGSNVGGKYLQWAYKNWYSQFVVSAGSGALRVQRPESGNDSDSQGIALGMLIAVYMNDPTLFAGLWQYWSQYAAAGSLMTWDVSSAGVAIGTGSASDADQHAAFALIEAGKKFSNASYASAGAAMLADIWTYDMDATSDLPTGGSAYGNSTSEDVTNTAYFLPAYYPTFATVDSTHPWASVTTAVYAALDAVANGTTGLVPEWCGEDCTLPGSNGDGDSNDQVYGYDANQVPLHIGLDYCWNGRTEAATFLAPMTAFFTSLTGAGATSGGGLDQLVDQYNLNGTPFTTNFSVGLVGPAVVGAMASASNQSFINAGWQVVLDSANRGPLGGQNYSYYHGTVGFLTLLTMSGNFYVM